jgi:hypothetical protein
MKLKEWEVDGIVVESNSALFCSAKYTIMTTPGLGLKINEAIKKLMFSKQFNKNNSLFICQTYFMTLMQLSIIIVSKYDFFCKIVKLHHLQFLKHSRSFFLNLIV